MWGAYSSLSPESRVSVRDVLSALDERYHDARLHEDAADLLERGEMPRAVPMIEDAVLPSTDARTANRIAKARRNETKIRCDFLVRMNQRRKRIDAITASNNEKEKANDDK
jgi:hypothetical protein